MKTYTITNLPPAIATQFAKVRCAIAGGHTLRFHYPRSEGNGVGFRVAKPHKMMVGAQGQWLVECYDITKKQTRHFTIAKMLNVSLPKGVEVGEQFFREADMGQNILTDNIPPNSEGAGAVCANTESSNAVLPGMCAPRVSDPSRPGGADKISSGASPAEPPRDHSYGTAARGMGLPVTWHNSTFSVLPTLAGSRQSHDLDRENNQQSMEALCRHAGESPEPDCGVSPAASAAMPAAEVPISTAVTSSRPDPRLQDLEAGAAIAHLVLALREALRKLNLNRFDNPPLKVCEQVIKANGASMAPITLYNLCSDTLRGLEDKDITPTACAPRLPTRRSSRLSAAEQAEVRRLNLIANRTRSAGSAAEATRRAIATGAIRPELAAELQAREAAGKPILTTAQRNAVAVSRAQVRSFRNGRDAWLEFNEASGSLLMKRDESTGEERLVRPGERQTLDDATMNFVALVPSDDPSCKHGVRVGRWQILVLVDCRSYCIVGYSHTARPRGSYRAEDELATMHKVWLATGGAPREIVLEQGISKANLITRAMTLAGVTILRAHSPHQKPVEFVFDKLWTKLSFEPGQVGRRRGEEADVDALIQSCRDGATNPRKHFYMLSDVLRVLAQVIEEWNQHWVNHSRYAEGGNWQPREFFEREKAQWLRPLDAQHAWMFAPHVTEPLKVSRMVIKTSVLMMPGYSQVFTFQNCAGENWLADFTDAHVRLHFNPFAPSANAQAVLEHDFRGTAAGTPLGELEMHDWHCRYKRRQLGYSDEADVGQKAASRNAQELRRSVVAIAPDGKPKIVHTEIRDGVGRAVQFGYGAEDAAAPQAARNPVARRARRYAVEGSAQEFLDRQAAEPQPEIVEY